MVGAVQHPGLPFNLRFQKGIRVNPYVQGLPVFRGQLELVGIAVLHLFHARQLDLGALGRVIDQKPIDFCLRGGRF